MIAPTIPPVPSTLRELCAKATPGKRFVVCESTDNQRPGIEIEHPINPVSLVIWGDKKTFNESGGVRGNSDEEAAANAQLIARFSPELATAAYEALEFYAKEINYLESGWQGDPDPAPVHQDGGKVARRALALLDGKETAP